MPSCEERHCRGGVGMTTSSLSMPSAVDRDRAHMNRSPTSKSGAILRWMGSRVRRFVVVLVMLGSSFFSGCGPPSPTEAEEAPHNLMVWGYVMARGFPAEGGVGLIDSAGVVVVTTPVRAGRYLVGLRLPPNTPICDRYRVQVAANVGSGAVELDERVLQESSGDCFLPPGEKVTHTVDFFLLEDSISSLGQTR